MADEEPIDVSKPKEPPKPVHIGGESLADRIIPHLKKIIVSVIVIAVILSIFFGIRAWKQSKQVEQTARLAKVLQVAQRGTTMPGMPPDPKAETFADAKTRAIALLDEAAKQNVELAPTVRGTLLLDAGRVDEAIAAYRKAIGKDGIDGVLAREGLGIALETKALAEKDATARQKLLEEALSVFASMQPKQDGPRRAYALYHQARIQQDFLRKTAEAKSLLEEAKERTPPLELAVLIEQRLASIGA